MVEREQRSHNRSASGTRCGARPASTIPSLASPTTFVFLNQLGSHDCAGLDGVVARQGGHRPPTGDGGDAVARDSTLGAYSGARIDHPTQRLAHSRAHSVSACPGIAPGEQSGGAGYRARIIFESYCGVRGGKSKRASNRNSRSFGFGEWHAPGHEHGHFNLARFRQHFTFRRTGNAPNLMAA